ncbi:hypothetical protein FGO68_gene13525 [Halteria grandinella]|uniref:Transmembrane protein n=1 Tax=Halteria grandinella TaxID=5974 RepID=A0A8J8TAJ2_HALGN|nr:hypothetical protein FGO68_gene13525 [Halteria grandinella]
MVTTVQIRNLNMNGQDSKPGFGQLSSLASSLIENSVSIASEGLNLAHQVLRILNTTEDNSTSATNSTQNTSLPYYPPPTVSESTTGGYEKLNTVHIANFSQFFKISAFFIAFLIFYAITVPLLMYFANSSWQVIGGCVKKLRERGFSVGMVNILTLAWVFYVIFTPLIALLIWGILLAKDTAFSTQFGLGITLIGCFVLFIFLGFCDWKGNDWYLSKFSINMFISATVSAFLYCFLVIFLPQYFTYNGTTAIFMALNFIFSSALTYLKTGGSTTTVSDKERFIKLDILVKSVVQMGSFSMSDNDLQQQKLKLKTVLQEAQQQNKRFFTFTKVIAAILYLLTFAAYIAVIIVKNPHPYKLVGLMHVLLLLTSDQVIYWLDNERGIFLVQDWFKCIYQFVMRFLCCFLLDYWLSMESLSYFITILIVMSNLSEKLIPRPPRSSANQFHIMCHNNPVFQAYVEKLIPDVICPQGPPEALIAMNRTNEQKVIYYLGEAMFVVHTCLYVAIAAGSGKRQSMPEANSTIQAKEFSFENTFHQWVIALFSLMFGLLLGLIYSWFRYFQSKNYQSDFKLYLSFIVIEGVSIALGFVFFGLLEVKVHLIWTSFAILPAVLGSFLLFIGHWISNDYFFYEKKAQPAAQVGDQAQAQQAAPNVRERLFQIDKEAFCTDFKKLISCGFFPRGGSTKDKLSFFAVILNVSLIILYTVLTSIIFKPWWVGFTIGFWIAIAQLTLIIFIKFYQTYYQVKKDLVNACR